MPAASDQKYSLILFGVIEAALILLPLSQPFNRSCQPTPLKKYQLSSNRICVGLWATRPNYMSGLVTELMYGQMDGRTETFPPMPF